MALTYKKPSQWSAATIAAVKLVLGFASKQDVLAEGAFEDGDKTKLNNLSGINTGDQDLSGYALKAIQVSETLTSNTWQLNGSIYEYELTNASITANSIVDIIPDNEDIEVVIQANLYPKTDSSVGSVKIYSKNLPDGDIGVTLNITEKQ